jgi:hypothetical protein
MTADQQPPVLTCWKEIAEYTRKSVRTVQRWEREFGLPVRRPNGVTHKSAVSANRQDIEVWLASSWSAKSERVRSRQELPTVQAIANLKDLIRSSQELRANRALLIQQTSVVCRALVETCRELKSLHSPN